MDKEINEEKYRNYMQWANINLPLFTKMLVMQQIDPFYTDERLINLIHENDLGEKTIHLEFFYYLYPENDAEFSRLKAVVDTHTDFVLGTTSIEPQPN